VELFSKSIKHNLRIKTFVGTSANALKIQIWTALIALLLVRFLQLRSKVQWHTSRFIALLLRQLFVYRDLFRFIDHPFEGPLMIRKDYIPDQNTLFTDEDIGKSGGGSIELVISRAVLEHIPPPVIQNIFIESERLLKPAGMACHVVDNSDHWQHNDRAISRINFLRYLDRVFRWTHINSLDYQNRLRHSEYIKMLEKAKLCVIESKADIDPQTLEDTKTVPLDERFQKFTPEDLATMNSYLLAQKQS